ncbi:MAG: choice-of-anchor D domain-containing protein [Proteobacteria bacterium]|nr:choice-of-anchor D domain-containing protein [Pseudomonadota bacterium]
MLSPKTLGYTASAINQASPGVASNAVAFGNVRIDSTQNQPLSVGNVATTAPQASLDAQLGAVTGAATSNGGTLTQLAPGATNGSNLVVGLGTGTAGAQSGSVTINLQSDSMPNGCTSHCTVGLASETVNVSGNVYRLANPTLNTTSVNLGAARVGGTAPMATISVTNTSSDPYTECLAATFGAAPTGFTSSGSIAKLAAQGTDGTSLHVALDTATAGTFTGNQAVNFTSNGAIDNAIPEAVGSGSVALTGEVYTPAVAQVNTTSPIGFGIVHVGDGGGSLSQSISVTNSAAITALNDTLLGSIMVSGAPFSGSGSLGTSGLAAGETSTAMNVDLSTATAGIYNGTASAAFASHDADLADLGLAGASFGVSAQVNNYAALAFTFASGLGSLTGSAATGYTLNLGSLEQNSGIGMSVLAFLNDNPLSEQAFTDLLSSTGSIVSGSGFSLSGDSVSGLAGGTSQGGFDIGLDTSKLGAFDELLAFDVSSSNGSGFDQKIGTVNLTLKDDVVAAASSVPEPGSLDLLGAGLLVLGVVTGRHPVRPRRKTS